MSFARLPRADQLRLEHLARHLCRLGPRAVAEALAEAADTGDLAWLERYERLSPELVDAFGGLDFPANIVAVPRG